MESKWILRIKKRPISNVLIIWIVTIPLLWGLIFHFLSLPSLVKYTADVAWLLLLGFMVYRKKGEIRKDTAV